MNQAISQSTVPAEANVTAPLLSIVVPTFKEHDNVAILVERVKQVLAGIDWEIIFVDDNSPDGTADEARQIGHEDRRVRCIRRIGRRGLAGACIEGILSSQADYIAVMDADLQHDESLLVDMLERIQHGELDLVVASRYMDGGSADAFSARRHLLSRLATRLAQKVLGVDLSDPMSGFFMIRRDCVEHIASSLSTQGYKILLDIVMTTHGQLRTEEVSLTFRERAHGESKLDLSVGIDFLSLIVGKLTFDLVSLRFILFGMVGLSGLVLHLFLLWTGLWSGLPFEYAQAVSTATIIAWNFTLNNFLTYRDHQLRGMKFVTGLIRFEIICSVGVISNISVASWVYATETTWWVAGIAGALMSVMWNYLVSAAFVWKVR